MMLNFRFSIPVFLVWSSFIFASCESDDGIEQTDGSPMDSSVVPVIPDSMTIVSMVDSASYNLGIPLYTSDQGKEFWTEFNTQIRPYAEGDVSSIHHRRFFKDNPYLECRAEGESGSFGVRMAVFKTLFDDHLLPTEVTNRITGLSFNALSNADLSLTVQILDANGNAIEEQSIELETLTFNSYSLSFQARMAKEVVFFVQSSALSDSTWFGLDDVYFKTNDSQPFFPPESDDGFLTWLKSASFNFFDWNYEQVSAERGVVLESNTDDDKVSLSGLGYAYAIFVLAAEEGYLSDEEAKLRIGSMLRWQHDQNWFDGSGGWHGFPHHYFRKDGSYAVADVSTIDWVMCAAGIRVVKQYYSNDPEMVAMAETLLARPDWKAALAEDDKIAMGFDGFTGEMNDYRWGLAFSEETELVYLEAVASGDLDAGIFDTIVREEKNGFYPSWFGAGFTYNWLQLWTGPMEPYLSNSAAAYQNDAQTSLNAFGVPVMGLTACSTIKEGTRNGFFSWSQYISNQGGSIHGAGLGQVIQISPAPYGAALALPFNRDQALTSLRAFVNMGYFHEYLGLPDNVRLKDLPDGSKSAANWDPFDINIGPVILAIEQIENNRIGSLYRADEKIADALESLTATF